MPGADGQWGGPKECALVRGDTTPPPGVHPAALGKVSDLFLPPAALTDAAGVLLDETYRPFTPACRLARLLLGALRGSSRHRCQIRETHRH